jgi:cell wall-associated NlpC family hydrolase
LFDGVVTVSSVHATDGKGTAAGIEIDGAAVSAAAGATVPVEGWGQLTLGATIGRVTSPLVLRLLQAHDSLPAGTVVAVAFAAASAQPVAKTKPKHQQAQSQHATGPSQGGGRHSAGKHHPKSRRQSPGSNASQRIRPSLDFWSHYSFPSGGVFATAAQHNAVVSTAIQYLGIPYLWGGATPKTGFDCSGLVSYVFAQLGVSLPHYTVSQYHSPDAVWVKPSRLEPGDLVFFTGSDGTRKAPGHVGIYVGDGDIIDAPHTGSFVRIDSFSEGWFAHKYVGAKRVVASLDGSGAQTVAARHLLHVSRRAASTAAILSGFPPITVGRGAPGIAAADLDAVRTAAHTSAARNWTGVGLGSVLLLLLLGAFGYRRHRREPSPESPS